MCGWGRKAYGRCPFPPTPKYRFFSIKNVQSRFIFFRTKDVDMQEICNTIRIIKLLKTLRTSFFSIFFFLHIFILYEFSIKIIICHVIIFSLYWKKKQRTNSYSDGRGKRKMTITCVVDIFRRPMTSFLPLRPTKGFFLLVYW